MAFLYSKIARKLIISLILLWGTVSFWIVSPSTFERYPLTLLALLCLVFGLFEIAPIFILIFSSFIVSYALYGFLFQFALPSWLIMISILLIFGYLFVYTEQKIGILGNRRLIYLVLFSLIVLEVFLVLNYFLISPISKSLIISTMCYLFVGFCYTILAKHTDNKLITYILVAAGIIAVIFSTSIWGTGV